MRLACVKHAASVHSEPGSNSQVHSPPPGLNPAADPNRPALFNLSPTHSQPPQQHNQDQAKNTQGTSTSQHQHPSADRASHPSQGLNPTTNKQNTQSSSPAPSHPIKEQPRTKHFQNRCNFKTATPDQPEDNLRGGHQQTIQQNPPSSAGQLTYRRNRRRSTPHSSGVGGFYGHTQKLSNTFPTNTPSYTVCGKCMGGQLDAIRRRRDAP